MSVCDSSNWRETADMLEVHAINNGIAMDGVFLFEENYVTGEAMPNIVESTFRNTRGQLHECDS